MLRADLQDAAISAAKARGHAAVEPRHVLFAIARRFRGRPEVDARFNAIRDALEPSGSSHGKPALTAEAAALLDGISTDEQAIAALSGAAAGTASRDEPAAGGQARQSGEVKVASAPPATTIQPKESVETVLAELDALIGLAAVKKQVRSVLAVVQANTERRKAGLTEVNPSLHLVFTGPPGTGKTTVARLISRLYAAAGALPGAGFTEVSRADLIAGYVGQTAIKTMDVINRTRPGVLFIDEAYALVPSSAVDFGHEAIATLVKAMEDYRESLAVIAAGYSEEMGHFVGANPGLRSRFKTYIDFPDYTPVELVQIFERLAAESGIQLAEGVTQKAEAVMRDAVEHADFGNGRFVRSLFEQAYARMAGRAAADGRVSLSELKSFIPDDLLLNIDSVRREARRIGFGHA